MKNIELGFTQRFKLHELLASQEGPLGKTAPYLRVMEKIRFTDEESAKITRRQISATEVSYAPPDAEFGKMTAELEDADSRALLELIQGFPQFRTSDHLWADPVVEALTGRAPSH